MGGRQACCFPSCSGGAVAGDPGLPVEPGRHTDAGVGDNLENSTSPTQELLSEYHEVLGRYAHWMLQPGLVVGYLIVDLGAVFQAVPILGMLMWALVGFGWLWLAMIALVQVPGVGCRNRVLGWLCGASGAGLLALAACMAGISGGLREVALVPYILVVATLGAGLTAGWVHFSLARSPLWAAGMALHPLLHVGAVGVVATILKGFGLPTGA